MIVIILLGFLPASLSKGVGFAANRTIIVLPFILIGLAQALKWLLQKNKFVTPLVSLIYLTHLVFFLYNYTVFSKTAIGEGMHIGKKELFERLMPIANNYPEVKISRTLSNPHIFFAFFTKLSPSDYQIAMRPYQDLGKFGVKFMDQLSDYSIGKFHFGDSYAHHPVLVPTLFVGKPEELVTFPNEYFHIDYPNGTTAFRVVEKGP